jgi:hypothetical protein
LQTWRLDICPHHGKGNLRRICMGLPCQDISEHFFENKGGTVQAADQNTCSNQSQDASILLLEGSSWGTNGYDPHTPTSPRPYHLQSDGRRHCAAGCCGDAVTSRLGRSSMRPSPHFGANGLGTADASCLAAVCCSGLTSWP